MSELIRREDVLDAIELVMESIDDPDINVYHCSPDTALKHEIAKLEPASPWHRVEEPPKEEHETYLVYTDTGYMCSCRWTNNVYGLGESDRWGWCLVDIPQFQKVIYWMPIEPPKEEK